MSWRDWHWAWLIVLAHGFGANAANTLMPGQKGDARGVPLQQVEPRARDAVRQVIEKPMLSGRGPAETFPCRPEHYAWFLDHPDRAVTAWRRLGAKCVSINPLGDGKYGWVDDQGSELTWETVLRKPAMRIWYAEGKVRPGPLLPLVPVKAVVVLRHNGSRAADGASVMRHQSELFVHTDSKTAAMMARMLGPTTQRLTESGLGQFQLFFSGLAWYLERNPDQEDELLGR